MVKNKTSILLNLLSTSEFDLLQTELEKSKNKRQVRLINALKKTDKNALDKELIYKQTYREKYSKEKDYLLRNDLRKLNKLIVDFIKQNLIPENNSIEYFRFLLSRKAYKLFEKEIQTAISYLKKEQKESLYEHQLLYFEFILRYTPRKENLLKKYRGYFINTIKETPHNKWLFKSQMLLYLSVLERITWQYFKIDFTPLHQLIDVNKLDKQAAFYLKKALTYQTFGNNRIDHLNNCIALLSSIKKPDFNKIKEKNYLESQLGLEYYLQDDFELSEKHYEEAYANFESLDTNQKIQLIYNYASMLCAANQFKKVIDLLDEHRSLFTHTLYETNVALFSVIAHINTNNLKNLREQLPILSEDISKDAQLYWRILECIILYYEETYDLVLNYLVNIYNTSRYNKNIDKAFKDIAKIFQHFISALLLPNKQDRLNKLKTVKEQSDNFISAYKLGFGSNMLCSKWLNTEISNRIKALQ